MTTVNLDRLVTFRAPIAQRLFAVIRGVFFAVLLCGTIAALFWLALTPAVFSGQPHWLWHGLGFFAIVVVLAGLAHMTLAELARRLAINDASVMVSGIVSDAKSSRHDLVLMRCITPKHALGGNRRVELVTRTGTALGIWLSAGDFELCLESIARIAPGVALIESSDNLLDPVNIAPAHQTSSVMAYELRRRARFALWAAVIGACCAVGCAVVAFHPNTGSFGRFRMAVTGPAVAGLSICAVIMRRRNLNRAQECSQGHGCFRE
jgi:hypothetical protein